MSVGSEAVFSPYYRDAYQNKSQANTFKDQLKQAPPPPNAPLTPDQQAVVNGDSSTLPTSDEQAPSGWSVANIANADGGLLANYLNGNCIMTVIQDGKPVKVSMFDELAKKLGFYISPQDEAKDVKSGQSLGLQAIETHVDMAWQALQTLVAFKNETMASGQSVSSSVVHDGKFLGLTSGHDADRGSNYGDLQDYLKDGRGPSSLQTGGDRVYGDGTTKSEALIGWQHFVHDIKQFVTILKDAIVGLVHIVEHLAQGIIYGLMGEGDKARAAFKAFGQEAKALVEGLVAPILDPIKLHKAEQKLAQDQREHPDDTALIAADEAAVKGDKVSVALDFLFLFIPDAGELKAAAQGLLKLGESVGRDAGAKAGEDTGKETAETGKTPVPEAQEIEQRITPNTDHDPLPSYEEASSDRSPAYYAVSELRMDDSGQLVLAETKSQSDDFLKTLLGGGDKDTKLQPKHMDHMLFGLERRQNIIVGMAHVAEVNLLPKLDGGRSSSSFDAAAESLPHESVGDGRSDAAAHAPPRTGDNNLVRSGADALGMPSFSYAGGSPSLASVEAAHTSLVAAGYRFVGWHATGRPGAEGMVNGDLRPTSGLPDAIWNGLYAGHTHDVSLGYAVPGDGIGKGFEPKMLRLYTRDDAIDHIGIDKDDINRLTDTELPTEVRDGSGRYILSGGDGTGGIESVISPALLREGNSVAIPSGLHIGWNKSNSEVVGVTDDIDGGALPNLSPR